LLRAPPPVDARLPRARDRQLAGRRVLRDRRARTDRRACADLDRRDEHHAGTDERTVPDHGAVLVRAVVVASDRAGADVDLRADRGVAYVGQMVHLAAGRDLAVLHLDEVADLHALGESGAGPQPRERPDLTARARADEWQHGVRVDDRSGAVRAVGDHGVRPDPQAVGELDPALDDRAGVDEDSAAYAELAADLDALGVRE